MTNSRQIAEGKTKIILTTDYPQQVLVRSKDDITAGDGMRHDILTQKSVLATTTTVNCFSLLRRNGILNHFIRQADERTFVAMKLKMIPREIVVRGVATGSYLKRRPDVSEGTRFDSLVVEIFDKDDAAHDPLIIYDFVTGRELFFDPKKPLKEGFIRERSIEVARISREVQAMRALAIETFSLLEDAWSLQQVTLVDLKIECGYDSNDKIVVGDVIDNDSWRIWPAGDKAQMKDKQVYRDMNTSADQAALARELGRIKENYAWVAEATGRF